MLKGGVLGFLWCGRLKKKGGGGSSIKARQMKAISIGGIVMEICYCFTLCLYYVDFHRPKENMYKTRCL